MPFSASAERGALATLRFGVASLVASVAFIFPIAIPLVVAVSVSAADDDPAIARIVAVGAVGSFGAAATARAGPFPPLCSASVGRSIIPVRPFGRPPSNVIIRTGSVIIRTGSSFRPGACLGATAAIGGLPRRSGSLAVVRLLVPIIHLHLPVVGTLASNYRRKATHSIAVAEHSVQQEIDGGIGSILGGSR